eukprot:scaffold2825_cov111-Isochrysis_galbana.AAC.1
MIVPPCRLSHARASRVAEGTGGAAGELSPFLFSEYSGSGERRGSEGCVGCGGVSEALSPLAGDIDILTFPPLCRSSLLASYPLADLPALSSYAFLTPRPRKNPAWFSHVARAHRW